MSLAKFEIFSTIVELGSFARAGEKLGLTQSAISHAIASLEAEWGFTILNRGRSGIHLTSNGEYVLKYINEILKLNSNMLQEIANIKGLSIGEVRIGTFSSVSSQWLPEILKTFNDSYPSIEIKLFEGNYDDIEHWILSGMVDFGFVSLPTSHPFDVMPLKKDRMVCILEAQHSLAHQKKVSLEEIKEEPLIMSKKGSDNDLRRLLKEHNIVPNIKFELADDQAIFSMVQHGMGVCILPEMVLYRVPENVCILNLEQDTYRTIGIAALSLTTLAPATKKFIEYLKSWLNEQPHYNTV